MFVSWLDLKDGWEPKNLLLLEMDKELLECSFHDIAARRKHPNTDPRADRTARFRERLDVALLLHDAGPLIPKLMMQRGSTHVSVLGHSGHCTWKALVTLAILIWFEFKALSEMKSWTISCPFSQMFFRLSVQLTLFVIACYGYSLGLYAKSYSSPLHEVKAFACAMKLSCGTYNSQYRLPYVFADLTEMTARLIYRSGPRPRLKVGFTYQTWNAMQLINAVNAVVSSFLLY